jgi:hypothetical protein
MTMTGEMGDIQNLQNIITGIITDTDHSEHLECILLFTFQSAQPHID